MSFLGSMGETMRCYALYRNEKLREYGLVGHQYLYVKAVCREPGLTQEKLAKELTFDKSSVARQLASLEEKGYVLRERNPKDRRVHFVYPTEKALSVMPRLEELTIEYIALIGQDLTPEERRLLDRLTGKTNRRAKEAVLDL